MISNALLAMASGFAREASYEHCTLAVASHSTRRGEQWMSVQAECSFFPKNPNFLNFNPQNDLQKCNNLLSTTWMHSNAITMLFTPFHPKIIRQNLTPKSPISTNTMLNQNQNYTTIIIER